MTKEEFIGKLQMCYFGDRNAFDEIVGEYDRLKAINEEYERLDKSQERGFNITDVKTYNINELLSYKSRIDKLNNIMNELEKYLKENIKLTKTVIRFEILNNYDERKYKRDVALFEMILDKLKELKDSD